MIKSLAILTATLAIAGPAAASDIRVSFIGKDDATLKAEVARAAATVCLDADHGPQAIAFYRECVAETVKETEAKIAEARATMAAAPERVASAR